MRQGPVERCLYDLERKFPNLVGDFGGFGRQGINPFNQLVRPFHGAGDNVIGRFHDRTAWEQGQDQKDAQGAQPRLQGEKDFCFEHDDRPVRRLCGIGSIDPHVFVGQVRGPESGAARMIAQ